MKKTLAITAAATLIAGAAVAQTPPAQAPAQTPSSTQSQSTPPAAAPTTNSATTGVSTPMDTTAGIAMSKSAREPVKFATADTGDLMTSKLVGVNVYNNENQKVGEIADIAIDNGKTLNGVVLSVGGFLGIGESYVLVQPSSLAVTNDNGTWKAYINTNKDSLKNAPKFTYKADNKKS